MKIGILQTGHTPDMMKSDFEDYGDLFVTLLDGHGFEFEIFSVVDDVFPDSITDADGWLITGSRYGAYDNFAWIPRLETFLLEAYQADLPIVGICFGHQILAQALGGKVEKYSGGWSIGATEYKSAQGETQQDSVILNAWHQDQVTEIPKEAKVVASAEHCKNAILVYGNKALTIQPHPEFENKFIHGLIDKRGRGLVPDTLLDNALTRLGSDMSNKSIAGKMATFFTHRTYS